MKNYKIALYSAILILGICSCNSIPNKPIFEKLSTDELARAIKSDTLFSHFYETIRKDFSSVNEIDKAKYNDITYRRLFNYAKYLEDTTYWRPLYKQWDKEWESKYGMYAAKADSVLDYWRKYIAENSLNKYAKVELTRINKEYYEYIGGIKAVNLGFKLTPLQGTVEQIRFNYGYKAKINGDDKYYSKHNCIATEPFSVPTVRYWEVGYGDRDLFSGATIETFLRDYNVYVEITDIRINGENKSTADFAVPDKVSECFENESSPVLFDIYKGELIKKLINKDYVDKYEYEAKKSADLREKKDKLCYDFLKDIR